MKRFPHPKEKEKKREEEKEKEEIPKQNDIISGGKWIDAWP